MVTMSFVENNDTKEDIRSEPKRRRDYFKKIKEFDEETNLSIYLGTGIYQIFIALLLMLFVSFAIGISLMMISELLPMILLFVKIFALIVLAFGIITTLSPFITRNIKAESKANKLMEILLKISIVITFILIPIGIFLGAALKSEIKKDHEEKREKKSVAGIYFGLLLTAGITHVVLGFLLAIIAPPLLIGFIPKAFPYLTTELINFLTILGWICLIPGIILLICSIWSKKFSQINEFKGASIDLKIIRALIIAASIFLVIVFPIGTFFGLTLIQEFYALKHPKEEK